MSAPDEVLQALKGDDHDMHEVDNDSTVVRKFVCSECQGIVYYDPESGVVQGGPTYQKCRR